MICIARVLGAPDTVPAGKHARSTSKASAPARSRPITWLTRCMTYEYRSVTMNSVTFTDPSSATRPTSLRPRSTSITCSARSFGSFFICRSMARSCASVVPRGRALLDAVALDAHQDLRRRAHDRRLAQAQEEEVRRRVDRPQRAVDGERIGLQPAIEPAREHDLVRVAGGDVLLGPAHGIAESLLVHRGGEAVLAQREQGAGRGERQRRWRARGA